MTLSKVYVVIVSAVTNFYVDPYTLKKIKLWTSEFSPKGKNILRTEKSFNCVECFKSLCNMYTVLRKH